MAIDITKHRILQAAYAPILAMAMAIMFGRLLVLAKVLDVESFAELNAALIVSGLVGMLTSFGLFLDLQRKLPGQLAMGQRQAAATQIAQSILGTATIALLGFAAAGLRLSVGSISPLAIGLGVFHGISQQLFLIVTTESRSNNEPMRFALQSLTRAVGMAIFAFPIAVATGLSAAVIGAESLVTLVSTLFISRKVWNKLDIPLSVSFQLGLRSIGRINWGSMASLLMLSLAVTASGNMDRWLSSTKLPHDDFAHYSFAWITLTAAFAVQGLINASVFPMIARRSALHGKQSAFRLTFLTATGMVVAFLVAIAPCVYIADIAIKKFYPSYSAAIPLIPLLAVAAALRISDFWSSFLVITGNERTSLIINVAAVASSLGAWVMTSGFFAGTQALGLAYLAACVAALTYLCSFAASYRYAKFANA
ncbi:O-antigen/teichoic acid export membrane protein [Bradyrhizobium sp. LB7.2]